MSQSSIKKILAPTVPLTLEVESADGSTLSFNWKLRINYNVLADAKVACGYNFMGSALDWVDEPGRIRALLWAALLPEQPDLRDEMMTIGECLNAANRPAVLEALFKAFSLYLHKDKREEFDKATETILSVVRTGKLPNEAGDNRPLAENENGASLSTGRNSEPSLATISESSTTKSSAA